MPRRIKIIDSAKQVQVKILFELKKVVSKLFQKKSSRIESQARLLIESALLQSSTVQSLLSGKLKKDFGLTDANANRGVHDIINAVVNSVNIEFDTKNKKEVGSIKINLLPASIDLIKNLPSGTYENDGPAGGSIDWLVWLLTKGTTIVIGGYSVVYGPFPTSRSGQAKMVEDGGFFQVDSEHAGTPDDNFITRTIETVTPAIIDIIRRELQ